MAETRPEHLMNGAGGTGGIQVNDRISEITACVIRFLSLTFLVPSRTVRSLRVWSSPPSSPVASLLSVRYGNEVSDVRTERETVPFGCARLTTLCSHFPPFHLRSSGGAGPSGVTRTGWKGGSGK